MNYLNGNITYEPFTLDQAYCLYGDGSIIANGNISGSASVRDYIKNFDFQNENRSPLMVVLPSSYSSAYVFFNIDLDYIYYGYQNYSFEAELVHFNEMTSFSELDEDAQSGDFYVVENNITSHQSFSNLSYGSYDVVFNVGTMRAVFDCSMMRYYFNDLEDIGENMEGHVWNSYDSKPDHSLFYNYALHITGYTLDEFELTIYNASNTRGSAISKSWQTAWNNGYSNGYYNGYADGYTHNVDEDTLTAFDYIGTAFNAVGGILELEVLPHVTLGLCFSIPLVLVLIMTLFKLVKK